MNIEELFENKDELLTEALRTELAKDVDRIYTQLFRDDVQKLFNGGHADDVSVRLLTPPTIIRRNLFASNELKLVFAEAPISILVNREGNHYNSHTGILSLSISQEALKFMKQYGDGTINGIKEKMPGFLNQLQRDLSPNRVKESIYHELAHYVDDIRNNKHLTRMIRKSVDDVDTTGGKNLDKIRKRGKSEIYLTDYEMEAMTHNVYQAYRKYQKIWDRLTFDDLMDKSYVLGITYRGFQQSDRRDRTDKAVQFKQTLIKRMNREGILGRRMR